MMKLAVLAIVAGSFTPVFAASDTLHVTAAEKAACSSDAVRLCISAYPDEMKLVGCMKQNRSALSDTCRVAFDAGVKRRRL